LAPRRTCITQNPPINTFHKKSVFVNTTFHGQLNWFCS